MVEREVRQSLAPSTTCPAVLVITNALCWYRKWLLVRSNKLKWGRKWRNQEILILERVLEVKV